MAIKRYQDVELTVVGGDSERQWPQAIRDDISCAQLGIFRWAVGNEAFRALPQ